MIKKGAESISQEMKSLAERKAVLDSFEEALSKDVPPVTCCRPIGHDMLTNLSLTYL